MTFSSISSACRGGLRAAGGAAAEWTQGRHTVTAAVNRMSCRLPYITQTTKSFLRAVSRSDLPTLQAARPTGSNGNTQNFLRCPTQTTSADPHMVPLFPSVCWVVLSSHPANTCGLQEHRPTGEHTGRKPDRKRAAISDELILKSFINNSRV